MLEEKIMENYKEAMKSRDTLKISALNFLRAKLKDAAIEKKKRSLEDEEVVVVIKKQIKQRQDSVEQFKKGSRLDLADKENAEIELLKAYLPQELSLVELEEMVKSVIAQLGAGSMKDMGRVIKEVSAKAGGKADNKTLADLVKEKLK